MTLENSETLNTMEAKDQEIEALKGQVAAFNNELFAVEKEIWHLIKDDYDSLACIISLKLKQLQDIRETTQATAEAFIASIRADEREKAIREVLELRYLNDRNDSPDKDKIDAIDVEALLTKKQA